MQVSRYARHTWLVIGLLGTAVATTGCGAESAVLPPGSVPETLLASVILNEHEGFRLVATATDDPAEWLLAIERPATSDIQAVTFQWSFGDGSTATGDEQLHLFPAAGFYSVTATAVDDQDVVAFTLATDIEVVDQIRTASIEPTLTADAGSDQIVGSNVLVFLDGSGSFDPSGQELEFLWEQIAGPQVFLDDDTAGVASFVTPTVSREVTLEFRLEVRNGIALAEDTVAVAVVSGSPEIEIRACRFTVFLQDGSEATGDLEGRRPLTLTAEVVTPAPIEATPGQWIWSIDGVPVPTVAGGDIMHRQTFTTPGVHTIALSLIAGAATVGCQSGFGDAFERSVTIRPTIAGKVVDSEGQALVGILVIATAGGGSDVTDGNGAFTLHVPYNWSGAIAAEHVDYDFSPASVLFSVVKQDVAARVIQRLRGSKSPFHCRRQADCDDGVFCNGSETCVAGDCVRGSDPCPGQICDEETNTCQPPPCTSDADCDDGNGCTDDSCDVEGTGACVFTNNTDACDDGVSCNGSDTCSGGTCSTNSGDLCAPAQVCDATTDTCVDCLVTADCAAGEVCINKNCITAAPISGSIFRGDGTTLATLRFITIEAWTSSDNCATLTTRESSLVTPDGTYSISVPVGFTGCLVASGDDMTFVGAATSYNNVQAPFTDQDYTSTYNIFVDGSLGADADLGTSASPKATIQAGVDLAGPGDTVIVRAGTYTETVRVTASGTAAAPITVRANTGDLPVVDGEGVRDNAFRIGRDSVIDTGYIIIDGFDVKGAVKAGMHVEEMNNVTIRNCFVHDHAGNGIEIRGGDDCVIEYNEVFRNRIGIRVRWRDTNSNRPLRTIVRRNIVHDNLDTGNEGEDADGIEFFLADDGLIDHNIVYSNRDDGIDVSGHAPGGSDNNRITFNAVFDNGFPVTPGGDGNGIKWSTNNGGGNTIDHNISFRNKRGGFDQDIELNNDGNKLFNNIAWNNGLDPSMTRAGFILEGSNDPLQGQAILKNNVGANNDPPFVDGRGDFFSKHLAIGESDFNNWGVQVIVDLDAATGQIEGPSSISAPPLFCNPDSPIDTDTSAFATIPQKWQFLWDQVEDRFSLQAISPCIDAGTPVPGITDGFEGLAPDMGAFEFVGPGRCP